MSDTSNAILLLASPIMNKLLQSLQELRRCTCISRQDPQLRNNCVRHSLEHLGAFAVGLADDHGRPVVRVLPGCFFERHLQASDGITTSRRPAGQRSSSGGIASQPNDPSSIPRDEDIFSMELMETL